MKLITPSECLTRIALFNARMERLRKNEYTLPRLRTQDLNALKFDLRKIISWASVGIFNKNQERAKQIIDTASSNLPEAHRLNDEHQYTQTVDHRKAVSYVSRSVYQKQKEENRKLLKEIEALVDVDNVDLFCEVSQKWMKHFADQKEQPLLWKIAREKLKTLSILIPFLLLSVTAFSQGRFTKEFQEADSVFTAKMELKSDSLLLCESLKLIDALGSDTVMIRASDAVLLYYKGYTDCIIKYNDTKQFDFQELNNQIKQLSKSIKRFSIQKNKSWKKQ